MAGEPPSQHQCCVRALPGGRLPHSGRWEKHRLCERVGCLPVLSASGRGIWKASQALSSRSKEPGNLLHRPNSAEALARLCIRLVLVALALASCSAVPSDPTGPYFTFPLQPVTDDNDA